MPDKLTVKGLRQAKGNRRFTQVNIGTAEEARACEAAGIDMLITWEGNDLDAIRKAAPNTFLTSGQTYGRYSRPDKALQAAYRDLSLGVDAVYCPQSLNYVHTLSAEGIPVIGHIGFVPYKKTWHGGFVAVGKTAAEAVSVYRSAIGYQDAGAIAIEIEIVPEVLAGEISRRLDILTIGMGAGAGTDAQYLFAGDILGTTVGRVPRHAKVYRNHRQEYERLYQDAITAFAEFRADVADGTYPGQEHKLKMNDAEYTAFLTALEENQE